MTRWIVLIASVVVLTGLAAFLSTNATNSELGPTAKQPVVEVNGPQPKVEISGSLIHDFGMMSQHRKGSHIWEVKNAGSKDLEMWMEKSTCSCTIAKLATGPDSEGSEKKKVRVKPNTTTPIELEWDTRDFQKDYSKAAWIGTNDPARPTFTLSVKGIVFPPVLVHPPEMITMNGISNEELTHATVAVYSMDMANMKITKLSTGRPEFITAKQSPMTDSDRMQLSVPAGGFRVDVEVKPGLPLGRFSDTLVIETDHPLQKETKVSIRGYTTGPISVVPDRIRLTGVNSATGASQSLSLLVRGGKETKFEVVQKPDENIDVTIAPYDSAGGQKGRYRLTVSVPPGMAPANIQNDIIIKTDHLRASEIKIPVQILITKPAAN